MSANSINLYDESIYENANINNAPQLDFYATDQSSNAGAGANVNVHAPLSNIGENTAYGTHNTAYLVPTPAAGGHFDPTYASAHQRRPIASAHQRRPQIAGRALKKAQLALDHCKLEKMYLMYLLETNNENKDIIAKQMLKKQEEIEKIPI